MQLNVNQWSSFFTDGTNSGVGGNFNMNVNFRNMWFAYLGIGGERGSFCGTCLRGGPMLREDATQNIWGGFNGDSRGTIVPNLHVSIFRKDGGRSQSTFISPYVNIRVASRFSGAVTVNYTHNTDDRQPLGNFGEVDSDTTHYTVGYLSQRTLSVTTRLNFTASPTLSLQF